MSRNLWSWTWLCFWFVVVIVSCILFGFMGGAANELIITTGKQKFQEMFLVSTIILVGSITYTIILAREQLNSTGGVKWQS